METYHNIARAINSLLKYVYITRRIATFRPTTFVQRHFVHVFCPMGLGLGLGLGVRFRVRVKVALTRLLFFEIRPKVVEKK